MPEYQLYQVGKKGTRSLAIPASVTSIHDLLLGWPTGVYTVMRTFQHNRFLSLEYHLDRLDQSLPEYGWDEPLPRSDIRHALHMVCSDYPYPEAQVRIDRLSSAVPLSEGEGQILIALGPFDPPADGIYQSGVNVGLTAELSRQNPGVKSAAFVVRRRKFFEDHPSIYEALLVDKEGFVKEGASSNFYGILDGKLWTADAGILPGTTRKIVFEIASRLNINVHHEPINKENLHLIDEAALSSSSRGIVPVVRIGEMMVGNGRPGEIVLRLMDAYREYVEKAVKPAVESPRI